MGMSYKSPGRKRPLGRSIKQHALDRMRQRTKVGLHLTDYQLRCCLDTAIDHALFTNQRWLCFDRDNKVVELVDISETLDETIADGKVCAVIRDDRAKPGSRAVVTILPLDVVHKMRECDISLGEAAEILQHPFQAALADLRLLKPGKEKPVQEKVPKLPVELMPPGTQVKVERIPRYLVMHTISGEGDVWGERIVDVCADKETCLAFLASHGTKDYDLFKEVWFKTKIEVEEST